MKFKVGDRVKVVKDYSSVSDCTGETGIILNILYEDSSLTNLPYLVKFDNPELDNDNYCDDELELCEDSIDMVNHPQHYTAHPSGIECIEVARHFDFCIGNAIKYLWRSGLKQEASMSNAEKEIEDLKKAIFYIQDKINQLTGS